MGKPMTPPAAVSGNFIGSPWGGMETITLDRSGVLKISIPYTECRLSLEPELSDPCQDLVTEIVIEKNVRDFYVEKIDEGTVLAFRVSGNPAVLAGILTEEWVRKMRGDPCALASSVWSCRFSEFMSPVGRFY